MLTQNDQVACDGCGRFISMADLMSGAASHHMLTPDSHFTREEYESECAKCKALKTAKGTG